MRHRRLGLWRRSSCSIRSPGSARLRRARSWRRPRSTRAGQWARRASASAITSRRSRVLPGLRAAHRARAAARARAGGVRRAGREISRRRRSADLLRALARRHADRVRQDVCRELKAAGILEKLFDKYPDHPGVAHYLIHSYDSPPIAHKGRDRRAPLRGHRTRRAARAAHALAHLHARRRLGGLGGDQPPLRPTSRGKGNDGDEALHAIRLHGLRLPADRARRRGAKAISRGAQGS